VARLLALAHRFRGLVESGDVRDYADVARLAGVTRARATQILNLLHLAPDIQEAVLDLPRVVGGRDPITERGLRPLVATPDWPAQRALWRALVGEESQRVDLDVSGSPRPHVSGGVAMGAPPNGR
jgi:alkylated DNA nucleotide flippase Atl1